MSKKEKAQINDIRLVAVQGNKTYAQYWHIFYKDKKAGKVYIKANDAQPSISIELNKPYQGLGIGRIALAEACYLSQLPEIFATIAKTNIASYKSALYAGFKLVPNNVSRQLRLVWRGEMTRMEFKARAFLGEKWKESCEECRIGDVVKRLPNEQTGDKRTSVESDTGHRVYVGGEIYEFRVTRYRMNLQSSKDVGEHQEPAFDELHLWERVS